MRAFLANLRSVFGDNPTTLGGVMMGCSWDGREAAVTAAAADVPLPRLWSRKLAAGLDVIGRGYDGRNDRCACGHRTR